MTTLLEKGYVEIHCQNNNIKSRSQVSVVLLKSWHFSLRQPPLNNYRVHTSYVLTYLFSLTMDLAP